MTLFERWDSLLADLDRAGRYRRLALPQGVDFSSNDYLGFGSLPLEPAWIEGDEGEGPLARSGQASRLLRGHHAIWNEVEQSLADWHGAEAALVFTSGYVANEGLLSTVIEAQDFVASDQLNHASLIDGVRLSKAERFVFRHNDLDHLESGLRTARRPGRQLFVVTESIFGMDGDRAPLEGMADLCERHGAHLIVDEAHATGCFGPRGSGLVDEAALRGRILASVHTGGKALGVAGAYVCGPARLRELLINRCRHFIFTTALPPAIGACWLTAVKQTQLADDRRRQLHQAAALFRRELKRFDIPAQGGHYIVPMMIGPDQEAVETARALQEAGWDIRAIRPPSVPPGTARLRIAIHADHEPETLKAVAAARPPPSLRCHEGVMNDLIVLGTDTDAGKTTFCLLWLAKGGYEYWKPVETGDSDSERVARLVPDVVVHPPLKQFTQPVAPPLAARMEKDRVPPASVIASARPQTATDVTLLIETFGGPFSPLNDDELQIDVIRALGGRTILICSSALGAVGRTLSMLQALAAHEVFPAAIVLVGQPDDYALRAIEQHQKVPVFHLLPPVSWDAPGIKSATRDQAIVLENIGRALSRQQTTVAAVDLAERDRRAVWHPYTSLCDPDAPLTCVGAQDEFLFLGDGRRIIDGISSWWTILHGHRHPVLLKALHEATRAFDHVHFAGVTHAPAVELAELLLSTAPWQGGRVFYSDNGSTAVEVALKMAYQYWCHRGEPQRARFVGFEGGYHGDTFGAMAISRDPVFFGTFEPLLFRADILPLDANHLDDFLKKYRSEVAAVIVEPLVQGAGGMRMHTPALLRQLAEVAQSQGVLFIADEVMTGGGRTGSLWAHQQAGIAPDLICTAKTLAGGVLPLAATLAAPHIVAAWDTADAARTFFHGHSFTAHPLACAVAVANCKMLTEEPGSEPKRIEAFWKEALQPTRARKGVRDVRICGTIAAVELDTPGGYLANVGRIMRRRCLEAGVLLRPLGPVLYAMPPLCTSRASLEQIAQAMEAAVFESVRSGAQGLA